MMTLEEVKNDIKMKRMKIQKLSFELKEEELALTLLLEVKPLLNVKEKRERQLNKEREEAIQELNRVPRRQSLGSIEEVLNIK